MLITEVQPNPPSGPDAEEWVELQNLGPATVAIGGWEINDFSGANEVNTRWGFPATASIAPGQVIIVARDGAAFRTAFQLEPTYEMALMTSDDPAIENMVPRAIGGATTQTMLLANTGDALVVRDENGMFVTGVEWGGTDRAVIPGVPFSTPPGAGSSLQRIANNGSSATDFIVRMIISPYQGFTETGAPLISNVESDPRHAVFGSPYEVTATVVDTDGVQEVAIYLNTATSSRGPAALDEYIPITMDRGAAGTATAATYTFEAEVGNLGPGLGFNEPATFHERYIRFFIEATDTVRSSTRSPAAATNTATNTAFLPSYVQNVLPRDPSPIAEVREQNAMGEPIWRGHSARVQGVALIPPNVMQPGRTNFSIQDSSGRAISYFNGGEPAFDFEPGQIVQITGSIDQFLGQTQIAGTSSVVVLNQTGPVTATTLTIADLLRDGEDYESELVTIEDVDFVTPRATWPDDDMNLGSWNVDVTDGTGEVTLRVTPATDLFGRMAPQFGFSVTGVLSQRNADWQIFPRSASDIVANAPPPDAGVIDPDSGTTNPDGSTVRPDASVGPRADAGTQVDPPDEDDGCGCSTRSTHQAPASAAVLALLGLALLLRRRK